MEGGYVVRNTFIDTPSLSWGADGADGFEAGAPTSPCQATAARARTHSAPPAGTLSLGTEGAMKPELAACGVVFFDGLALPSGEPGGAGIDEGCLRTGDP